MSPNGTSICPRNSSACGRGPTDAPTRPARKDKLDKSEQAPRIAHRDGVDFVAGKPASAHQRDHVREDVLIAVPAITHQARARADVLADDDAIKMSAIDQEPDRLEPARIV